MNKKILIMLFVFMGLFIGVNAYVDGVEYIELKEEEVSINLAYFGDVYTIFYSNSEADPIFFDNDYNELNINEIPQGLKELVDIHPYQTENELKGKSSWSKVPRDIRNSEGYYENKYYQDRDVRYRFVTKADQSGNLGSITYQLSDGSTRRGYIDWDKKTSLSWEAYMIIEKYIESDKGISVIIPDGCKGYEGGGIEGYVCSENKLYYWEERELKNRPVSSSVKTVDSTLKQKFLKKLNAELKEGSANFVAQYNTLYPNAKLYMSVKQSNGEVIQVPFKDPVRQQGSLITDKLENLQEGQCTLGMRLTAPNIVLNPDNFESYGGANDNLSVNMPSDEILERKFYVKDVRATDRKVMDYEIVTPKTSHIYCVEEDQNKVQIPIVIVPRNNYARFTPDFYAQPSIINEFSFSYSLENRNNDFFTSDFKDLRYMPFRNYDSKDRKVEAYASYLEISNYALPEGRDKEKIFLNVFYEEQQEQVNFYVGKCDAETAFTQKWEELISVISNDGFTLRDNSVQTPIPSGEDSITSQEEITGSGPPGAS